MLFQEDDFIGEDAIVGVLSISHKDYPAVIFWKQNKVIIRSCQDEDVTDYGTEITVDPIGILEMNIIPHPSACLENGKENYMQAMIVITYLSDLYDNESIITFSFSGIKNELKVLNEKIVSISSEFRKKIYFEVPVLSSRKKYDVYKSLNTNSFELINGPSSILNNNEINDLRLGLPARMRKLSWKRIFNTNQDGYSFRSLYYSAAKLMPLILLIKANDGLKFGSYLSCGLKHIRGYSGNGETFVFHFKPDLQIFNWTKSNTFFVSASNEELVVGGGKGAAIFLTNGLRSGVSDECLTFNSPILTNKKCFVVSALELWCICK